MRLHLRLFAAAPAGLLALLLLSSSIPAAAQGTPPVPPAAAPAADPLLQQVDAAIDVSSRRYLDADSHTPWQIIHGVLAYRKDFQIKERGEKINAVEFLSGGATYKGTPWFEVTQWGGRGQPFSKPYLFEGHPNQFLGYLTMSDLPLDHEIQTPTRAITIGDIVRNAQMDIQIGEEPTWTLWALAHYLEPDAVWENKDGEPWSIERLVRSQVYEPVHRAACGGTHGLFALAYARDRYLATGQPLRGAWLEADQKIKRYIEEARSLQNPDGSFSSNFFQGRQHSRDAVTRIGPSGHTLEFLMMALPQERLRESWVRNGIASVARDLIDSRSAPVDCGPLYHAVDGLVIYRDRMTKRETSKSAGELAGRPKETTAAKPVFEAPPPPAASSAVGN